MISLQAEEIVQLYNLIDQQEGLNLNPYQDTKGLWTFGYGSRFPLLQNEVEFVRNNRLSLAEIVIMKTIPFYLDLDPVRRILLIDMVYNMGIDGVLEFKDMLGCMKNKDWTGASEAMLNSTWRIEEQSRCEQMAYLMEKGVL